MIDDTLSKEPSMLILCEHLMTKPNSRETRLVLDFDTIPNLCQDLLKGFLDPNLY